MIVQHVLNFALIQPEKKSEVNKDKIDFINSLGCVWSSKFAKGYPSQITIGHGLTMDVCCLKCKGKVLEGEAITAILYYPANGNCRCIIGTYTTSGHGAYRYAKLTGIDPGK